MIGVTPYFANIVPCLFEISAARKSHVNSKFQVHNDIPLTVAQKKVQFSDI